ncbi:DUF350 domain-containing protein [Carboxylicivirga sp. N1Y90]|uniref:DUF350 domain-containing protein n=1 Tax=Carboxylicivirga fragile TaxID=3417571 RepID=UPI003D33E4D3|nr:DUF350 domain-containing protein [Marinilabiliaceae bacterium N1Y90]
MTFSDISTILYDAVAYIAVGFIIFFVGKLVYQLVNRDFNIKEELVEKDNLAFSFAHVGYFIGLLLAVGSAIVGPTQGLVNDIIDIAIYGGLGIILLNLSIWLNDKIILRKFSVKKEIIEDRNAGTGVIEGAISIASGLIIFGAVTGESGNLTQGISSAVVFWLAGQVALFITAAAYQLITPYDVHEHIEKDNVAVGVGFAGALIAIANLIRHAITGDFEGWGLTFGEAGFELVLGIILLPVMRFLTDKILLPGQRLTDEIINQEHPNIGASIIEAFAYIGGSIMITWCL